MFTQPLMYQKIRKHENVFRLYTDKLLEEGLVKQEDIDVSFETMAAYSYQNVFCSFKVCCGAKTCRKNRTVVKRHAD